MAPPRRDPPRWLTRAMLVAIHGSLLRGRQESLIRSALAAPTARLERDRTSDLPTLAAMYLSALAQMHGFIAHSRRTAFLAAYVFLGLNGYDIDAPEPEVAMMVRRVADRELSETELAEWFRRVMMHTR